MSDWSQILYLVLVLVILLPTVFYVFRQQKALRNLAIWVAIFTALVVGYHYVVEAPKLAPLNTAPANEGTSNTPGDAPAVETL